MRVEPDEILVGLRTPEDLSLAVSEFRGDGLYLYPARTVLISEHTAYVWNCPFQDTVLAQTIPNRADERPMLAIPNRVQVVYGVHEDISQLSGEYTYECLIPGIEPGDVVLVPVRSTTKLATVIRLGSEYTGTVKRVERLERKHGE